VGSFRRPTPLASLHVHHPADSIAFGLAPRAIRRCMPLLSSVSRPARWCGTSTGTTAASSSCTTTMRRTSCPRNLARDRRREDSGVGDGLG
jgi:hypothetical protein